MDRIIFIGLGECTSRRTQFIHSLARWSPFLGQMKSYPSSLPGLTSIHVLWDSTYLGQVAIATGFVCLFCHFHMEQRRVHVDLFNCFLAPVVVIISAWYFCQ